MEACIDEIIGRSQMVLSVTSVNEREVLEVGIIIEGEIVEHHYAEEFQYLNRSSIYILADDISTFLITQVAVFVITTSIDVCQTR